MKIHSDVLKALDMYNAVHAAGMRGVDVEVIQRGSRSRQRGFDISLSGTSNRWQNPGTGPRDDIKHAATWDEWGMFINALYEIDPAALIGPYKGQYDFEYKTADRFESLTQPYAHGNHKWEYVSPRHFQCKDCEAEQYN